MPWLTHVNPDIDWRARTITPRTMDQELPPTPPPTPNPESQPTTPTTATPTGEPKKKKKRKRKKKKTPTEPPVAPESIPTSPTIESIPEPSTQTPSPTQSPTNPTKRPTIQLTTRIHPTDQVFLMYVTPNSAQCNNTSTKNKAPVRIPDEYKDFAEVFSKKKASQLPPHRGRLDHSITLEEGSKPTYGPIYNLSETELSVLKEYIEEHLERGSIKPSTSPFGAPVLFVKKADGSLRLCVDYRALNRMTIKNRYPLPLIQELMDRVNGARRFTKIDLLTAYHLLRIALGDEWKTAFRTRYDHFEYLVMPLGLTNAPAMFQAYINEVLYTYFDEFCVTYLDDILIYFKTQEEYVQYVCKVLKKLLDNGLYVTLEECQ